MAKTVTKVAVIGSRTTSKEQDLTCSGIVQTIIRDLPDDSIVISGGCVYGADKWVKHFCSKQRKRIHYVEVPAIWKTADKDSFLITAGIIRNKAIAQLADYCVAVWDGKSSGTANCMEEFKKLGKAVEIVNL